MTKQIVACRNFARAPKKHPVHLRCGPGNVVSIATGYGPDGPEIESR